MFKKIFEYAGPYKKNMYVATVVVLVSVLMGVLPFVLAYQVIAPLVMGESIEASFIILRVVLVLACLVLQALFYGWGLNLSHKAAYDTLLRLRTALQKRFEKLPLGVIQDKGTGTVKKLFVDDVDSLDLEKIGPAFEMHERFPDRVNSEFIRVIDRRHLQMRVWERGSGETWACGTGATASAVASMMLGLVENTVEVQLIGGNLEITWDRESGHVYMTGPAVEVFTGEIDLTQYEEKN